MGHDINKNIGVDLTYNHAFSTGSDIDHVDAVMAGITYSFGN